MVWIGVATMIALGIGGCYYKPYEEPALQSCVAQEVKWREERDAGKISWTAYAQRMYDAVSACYAPQFQPVMYVQAQYRLLLAEDVDARRTDPIQADRAFYQFVTKMDQQSNFQPNRAALVEAYQRVQRQRQEEDRKLPGTTGPRAIVCEPQGAGFTCRLSKPAGPLG
jgi:hypothetical protein